MQHLTPEELDIIREFQANQQREPGPADLAAAAPPPAPDLAKPYNDQAAKYSTEADSLDAQAKVPAPQPQGRSQHLVEAARAAMENFGRLGAPGGFYGQEEQRKKDFTDANKSRIEQAKALRGEAAQQQQLGQQKTYQAGELSNQAGQLDVSKGNLAVSQQDQALKDKIANRPTRENLAPGAKVRSLNPDTNVPIPGTEFDNPKEPKDPTGVPAEYEYAKAHGYTGSFTQYENEDANRKNPTIGANGGMQVVQSTGPNNTPVYTRVKVAGPEGPIKIGGQSVESATQGNEAVKASAKEKATYDDTAKSFTALQNLAKQGTYASDQAMADQYFNIIKPGSGARMNEASIARLLTPGPLANKLTAMAQKLSQGQPLTPPDRQYMIDAAEAVLHARKPVGSAQTGGSDVFVKPGGALENLLKGGR